MAQTPFKLQIEQSGNYNLSTAGKFVDRDIQVEVPSLSESNITLSSEDIRVNSDYFNENGTVSIPITVSGTLNFDSNGKGFIKENDTFSENFSHSVIASMNDANISVGGSATSTAEKNGTHTIEKVNNSYNVTIPIQMNITGSVDCSETNGYYSGEFNSTPISNQSIGSIVDSLNVGQVTVSGSGKASKPTISAASGGNISSTPQTSKPAGYSISVYGKSASSTGTLSKSFTEGYIANDSEITANNFTISASDNGNTYYLPVTTSVMSGGDWSVSGSTLNKSSYKISTAGYQSGTDNELSASNLSNTVPSGKSASDFLDISSAAPVLNTGSGLYITKGYIDDVYISLAQLIPDDANITNKTNPENYLLQNTSAYDNNGNLITGSIPTKGSSDISVSGRTVTVPAGYYETQQTKSIAQGSVNSFSINEATQANVILTAGTKNSGYYSISVSSLDGTVNRTAGYISGTSSTTSDSNGGVVGKIIASTTSKTDGTVSANANTSHNLVDGTYSTSSTNGYTYHIDASASASTTAASVSVSAGYTNETISASTASSNSGEKTSHIYIKDSTSKVGGVNISSGSMLSSGTTLTIGAGYYPIDRTFIAPTALDSVDSESITGSLSCSISNAAYSAPTFLTEQPSSGTYISLSGNGTMTTGNIFNGTSNAQTKYLMVYDGSYSVS